MLFYEKKILSAETGKHDGRVTQRNSFASEKFNDGRFLVKNGNLYFIGTTLIQSFKKFKFSFIRPFPNIGYLTS